MKPVLFSTHDVQAVIDGRKTQFRHIAKLPNYYNGGAIYPNGSLGLKYETKDKLIYRLFPKFEIGDILYVRETFAEVPNGFVDGIETGQYIYRADKNENGVTKWSADWKSSMHMPKEAARIFLKVTDVKAERLQYITEADAIADGISPVQEFDSGNGLSGRQFYENYLPKGYTEVLPIDSFQSLWRKRHGDESWNENPYVFAYTFERFYP